MSTSPPHVLVGSCTTSMSRIPRKSFCKWGHPRTLSTVEESTGACKTCHAVWRSRHRAEAKEKSKEWRVLNPERSKMVCLKWRESHPELIMLSNARKNAKERKVPYSLTLADIVIPDRCPVFGTPFVFTKNTGKQSPQGPSLDRIIPELGYVPGNVWVISWRANKLKGDASLHELSVLVKRNIALLVWGVLLFAP